MKIHFLGIGGSGESAVAAIAKAYGYEITGCDKDLTSEFLKPLKNIQIFEGHSKNHLYSNVIARSENDEAISEIATLPMVARNDKGKVDFLIITPAILSLDPENGELIEAKKQKIPILTWQQFLGQKLLKDKFVIAVAGTHGKTTTTAMIAQILEDANLDPTVELGAINPRWGINYKQSLKFSRGSNYRIGKSKYFVVEADEFNNNFLNYHPDIAVITNIEFDHPEYFKDFEEYKESFKKFIAQTKLKVFVKDVISSDNEKSADSNLEITHSVRNEKKQPEIINYSKHLIDFPLKVLGEFNKLNASAAFQVGLALNLDPTQIRKSLMSFEGVERRMEYLGEFNPSTRKPRSGPWGTKIFSDFAHHPTEIKVTIEAARKKYPDQKLWVIFQPHMFSRTLSLFEDFVKVLQNLPADQISILDIYPSREIDNGLVSSKQLVAAINQPNVSYLPGKLEDIEGFLKLAIKKNSVVFFVGAGDIDKLARKLIKE